MPYRAALARAGRAVGTITQRVGDLERYTEWGGSLTSSNTDDLHRYLESSEWSAEYRKKITASFRAYFRWAQAEGLIDHDPAAALPSVAVERRTALPAAPTRVVLDAFEAGTLHERAIIALAATMGMRRTEIASLHPIDRTDNTLRVIGKNRTVRYLTLDENTLACLLSIEREQGTESYYFPGRFGGHVHPATIYKWAKALIGDDWTLHACRRRAATEGYRATKNVFAVQQFLGHASVATTQIYVDVHADDVAAVANAATLARNPTSRHLAGQSRRSDTGETEEFLRDLARLTRVAREHGMELVIR